MARRKIKRLTTYLLTVKQHEDDSLKATYEIQSRAPDDQWLRWENHNKYKMKLNPAKCAFDIESDKFLGFIVSKRGIEANHEKI